MVKLLLNSKVKHKVNTFYFNTLNIKNGEKNQKNASFVQVNRPYVVFSQHR